MIREKNIEHKNKLHTYRKFKNIFHLEPHLLYLNKEERHTLTKFRISSHRLEVERGRYFGLKFENRICKLCNDHVEDEEHFMISCKKNLEHIRVDYLNFITNKYPNFQFLSNELKFIWLLISEDRLIMSSVAKLLVKLFEKRYTLLNGGVASLSSK